MTAASDLWLDMIRAGLAPEIATTTRETWPTPGALAMALDRSTVQTPALDLIDEKLTWLLSGADRKLIISMAPQEGKSRRVARDSVVYALKDSPERRIVLASYDLGLARRNGRALRDMITANNDRLGLPIRADLSGQTEWQIAGHIGGVYAVGIGGALAGRPADLMVIDDPIKDREQADSEVYRQRAWDWWTDVASARLSPGAPVVLISTRWHEDDFLPQQHPDLVDALKEKCRRGCRVRLTVADPASEHVRLRDEEEQEPITLVARIHTSLRAFAPLLDCPNAELRYQDAPLYNSLFRFDDEMFVTPMLHATPGHSAPLFHLRRLGPNGMFSRFAGHFESIWASTQPIPESAFAAHSRSA